MTQPSTEPTLREVVDELRSLRNTMQEAVESAVSAGRDVAGLRADLTDTSQRSDRRARWFRGLWAVLAVASVTFFVIDRIDANRAEHQQSCFQQWANATAHRTQTINAVNSARIDALDHVLDVRRTHTADSPIAQRAIAAAAAAADAYERVAASNPPIPPEQVFCAGNESQTLSPPTDDATAGAATDNSAPAPARVTTAVHMPATSDPTTIRSAPPRGRTSSSPGRTSRAKPRSSPTPRPSRAPPHTTTRTVPAPSQSTPLLPGVICPVIHTNLLCSSETP